MPHKKKEQEERKVRNSKKQRRVIEEEQQAERCTKDREADEEGEGTEDYLGEVVPSRRVREGKRAVKKGRRQRNLQKQQKWKWSIDKRNDAKMSNESSRKSKDRNALQRKWEKVCVMCKGDMGSMARERNRLQNKEMVQKEGKVRQPSRDSMGIR